MTAINDKPEWAYFAEALAWYPGHGLTGAQVFGVVQQVRQALADGRITPSDLGLVEVEVETRFEGPGHMGVDVPYVCPVDWRNGCDDIKPSTVRLFMWDSGRHAEGEG